LKNYVEKTLASNVSYQKDTWANLSKQMTVENVLTEIKSDVYRKKIENLRELLKTGNNELYKVEKLKLPAVTFCGTFNEVRKKENLKEYNELIVIDIDKLKPEQLSIIKNQLTNDEYIFSFWLSPSNNGFKGLVLLKYNFEINAIDIAHKSAFDKLAKYFSTKYNIELDSSGSDTTRLCFMSHDPSICIKTTASAFEIEKSDLMNITQYEKRETSKIKLYNTTKKNALYNPKGKNRNTDKRSIKDIITYLTKRRIVITGQYEHRYRICYAIANTFTYDIGLKFYLDLCRIEVLKYNENKEMKLLEYCYENNTGWIQFNYIEELVKNYGYVKKILEKVVS
jgi:VirE N-terminal domain